MSIGSRRDGTRKVGRSENPDSRYAGRHSRHKAARKAIKAVPVAMAATLAAGAATYMLTGSGQPAPSKLGAALSAPVALNAFTHAGIGKPEAAASVLLTPRSALSVAARPSAQGTPAARPSARPAQSAAATQAAAHREPARPAARPTQTPTPAATRPAPSRSASASQSASATTVSCSGSSYLLPANVTAIVSFLLANGYTRNAAAGIAGNIYQESKGDPESIGMGGGGLIGWTPLPSGFVTGNPTADLRTQLAAVLTFNNGWSGYLPALNSAATPADAAYIYVTDFERAGIPAASTRESSAEAVASACNL